MLKLFNWNRIDFYDILFILLYFIEGCEKSYNFFIEMFKIYLTSDRLIMFSEFLTLI